MAAGANGYLIKDADGEAMLQAIHAVLRGETPLHPRVANCLIRGVTKCKQSNGGEHLTEREQEILRLITIGLSNKAIARSLNLSESTIKIRVSNILRKLDVTNRTEAAMLAVQMGLGRLKEEM
jgi:DNA-binding NarL/FixJ family response regulator